jgi:hypothetical protein
VTRGNTLSEITNFLHALTAHKMRIGDCAVALLWWYAREDHGSPKHLVVIGELQKQTEEDTD